MSFVIRRKCQAFISAGIYEKKFRKTTHLFEKAQAAQLWLFKTKFKQNIQVSVSKCAKSTEQSSLSSYGQDLDVTSVPADSHHAVGADQRSATGRCNLKTNRRFIIVQCENDCAVCDDNQTHYNGLCCWKTG